MVLNTTFNNILMLYYRGWHIQNFEDRLFDFLSDGKDRLNVQKFKAVRYTYIYIFQSGFEYSYYDYYMHVML